LITTTEELSAFLQRLEAQDRVALDTEADSLHCYFEKLCLLQFSIPGEDTLVDPLAELDFTPVFEVLSRRVVVMHGADYDLRLLKRYGTFAPGELIDTMLAARLVGEPQLGLAALIERHFGIKLCKASQRANWALRPLPEKMVEYALNDTRYLFGLADILLEKVDAMGRREWLRESVQKLQRAALEAKEDTNRERWKITGWATLSPRGQAILRELWNWRDQEARDWDRPPFHVMGNQDLIMLAGQADQGEAVSPRLPGNRRARFKAALEVAMNLPEDAWPVRIRVARKRPTPEQLKRFDSLKVKRDQVAASLQMDPSVLAPKAALEALANEDDAAQLMDWQKQLLGV